MTTTKVILIFLFTSLVSCLTQTCPVLSCEPEIYDLDTKMNLEPLEPGICY